jgi:F-type H+-transporting ATPase subunit gamma
MANVLDLRRRIRSVKNTRQITKAMQMVAAARLRRAQDRAMQVRPYVHMLTSVLESLVRRTDMYNEQTGEILHPLLVEREEKNVLVVVAAGDKGFAGAFNHNIAKAGRSFIDARLAQGKTVDIEAIGRKAIAMVSKRFPAAIYEKKEEHYDNDLSTHYEVLRHRAAPIEVTGEHPMMLQKVEVPEVRAFGLSIVERYTRAEIDSVYIVYNEFKSVIAQNVVVKKLLPIRKLGTHETIVLQEMTEEEKEAAAKAAVTAGVSPFGAEESALEAEAAKFGTADVDYIFDQDPSQIFRHLLPRYVGTQIFHALVESVASEQAARMTAMDAATNNAGEMIDAYTLQMNRVRQAAITKEIIEIVSGAAAL